MSFYRWSAHIVHPCPVRSRTRLCDVAPSALVDDVSMLLCCLLTLFSRVKDLSPLFLRQCGFLRDEPLGILVS